MARLLEKYRKEIVLTLQKEGNYKNALSVPKLSKIIVNMGVGQAIENPKLLDRTVEELSLITGQKPIKTKAKESIANFKLREGMAIGCKVTLRGKRMYEFLDRLVNVALPRVRDFRGLSTRSFDGKGNYSMGIREQIIFPEIEYDKIDQIMGMGITMTTTASSDTEAHRLLKHLGMPFREA